MDPTTAWIIGSNIFGGLAQALTGKAQADAMTKAAYQNRMANREMANITAGMHRDVGKGNIGSATADRVAMLGWGADLDQLRQKKGMEWMLTQGADLNRAAKYKDAKAQIALAGDPNYRASKRRQHERELEKIWARGQAEKAGMFGPISGGFT